MRKLLYVFVFLLLSLGALAQERKVTGNVTDEQTSQPISGANVSVKGTNTTTQKGPDGSFAITVPNASAMLVISFVGMETQEV